MTLSIDEISVAIKASRPAFATLFLKAQFGLPVNQRVAFEAVAFNAPDTSTAILEGLRYAEQHDWLDSLVDCVRDAGLENGLLAKAAFGNNGEHPLQAITNSIAGFMNPLQIYRGIADGLRWTAKIEVSIVKDGVESRSSGTGILIGPHLLLTSWHVVKLLFDELDGGWTPRPEASGALNIVLDNYLTVFGSNQLWQQPQTLEVKADRNWCVAYSTCHQDELRDSLPDDLDELKGLWDYAIIQLDSAPGLERRWAPLDAIVAVPGSREKMVIIQHPAGQTMKVDISDIVDATEPQRIAVPGYRFLHRGNATAGSSGGPCFDKRFMLFGLHQGVWIKAANEVDSINRGIPMQRVSEHIKQTLQTLPSPRPELIPVWSIRQANIKVPVIGCSKFSQLMWKSAVEGKPKLINITGSGESGKGKTFRVDILSSLLQDGDHLKIVLNAEAISKMDVPTLVTTICDAARAEAPSMVPPTETDSTVDVWLKDTLVPELMRSLDDARERRMVWLCLTQLNHGEIPDSSTSKFLFVLYDQIKTIDWLRIVLDGMQRELASDLNEYVETHRVVEITEGDIIEYLKSFLGEILPEIVDTKPVWDITSKVHARRAYSDYRRNLEANQKMTEANQRALENFARTVAANPAAITIPPSIQTIQPALPQLTKALQELGNSYLAP